MTCGLPGCCDSSKGKQLGDIIRNRPPIDPVRRTRRVLGWCYLDEAYLTQNDYLIGHA